MAAGDLETLDGMNTSLSSVERKLLGIGAFIYAAAPCIFLLGIIAMWIAAAIPAWVFRTALFLFIVFAGFLFPFHIVLGHVVAELLPTDQAAEWTQRFRHNPFAPLLFWRRYLR